MRAFPETFRFRVPAGFSKALADAAAREGLAASAYIRRILVREVRQLNERGPSRLSMHSGPCGALVAA